MNYRDISEILIVVASLIAAAILLLLPQIIGITIYLLLKQRFKLFAALLGFSAAPLFYLTIFYLWYTAPPSSFNHPPNGEGDIVMPALIGFGFLVNVVCGLFLYARLYIKNLQRTTIK